MLYDFQPGTTPLLLNVPHAGLAWPQQLEPRPSGPAERLPDTDWHVDRLLAGLGGLGAGRLVAGYSRYVIDLNRGRDDKPLYAGATTGLVPIETFDGDPVYRHEAPDARQMQERIERFWQPYHDKLAEILSGIRRRHGHAVLFDLHSIRSRVPRLFEGQLPDLNLGTYDGRSCAPSLQQCVADSLQSASGFSSVVNGRFKGGYITRHYGRPGQGIHALQLEMAQRCYMDEEQPDCFDRERARSLQRLLEMLIEQLIRWRPA